MAQILGRCAKSQILETDPIICSDHDRSDDLIDPIKPMIPADVRVGDTRTDDRANDPLIGELLI